MQNLKWNSLVATLAMTAAINGASAAPSGSVGGFQDPAAAAIPQPSELTAAAFFDGTPDSFDVLDASSMEDTRGELWPFVLGVVGLDIAISTYFWGTYVPSVSGGGSCTACTIPLALPR